MELLKKTILFLGFISSFNSWCQSFWVQKASLDSFYIQQAVGFSVYGKGYSVGGPDCFAGSAKQVLEYNPFTDTWVRLADFPGNAISAANGFAIGNLGYVITGRALGNNVMSQELWEFNPFTKTWTRKADLPGEGRCSAFAFSIGKKGYVGTGYNSVFDRINDFWEWDQQTDTWTQKADFPGKRSEATGFSIDTKGYAGLGSTDTSSCSSDFYEYNPATNKWTAIAPFPGGCAIMQSYFVICDRAYVGAGLFTDPFGWYEYEADSNVWTPMANVPGSFRKDAFAFSIHKKGYIGTGAGNPDCLNDFHEFTSFTNYDCNMTAISEEYPDSPIQIYPNPFSNSTTIYSENVNDLQIDLRDIAGTLLRTVHRQGGQPITLDRGTLPEGIYFVHLIQKNNNCRPVKLVLLGEN